MSSIINNFESSILLVPFTFSDLEQIKPFLFSDFDEFWNYDTLKEELKSELSKYIVLKNPDNSIIGFCGIKIIFDTAEIMNIVVKKSFRGKHLSTYMMNYIIDFCKSPHRMIHPICCTDYLIIRRVHRIMDKYIICNKCMIII